MNLDSINPSYDEIKETILGSVTWTPQRLRLVLREWIARSLHSRYRDEGLLGIKAGYNLHGVHAEFTIRHFEYCQSVELAVAYIESEPYIHRTAATHAKERNALANFDIDMRLVGLRGRTVLNKDSTSVNVYTCYVQTPR